MRTLLLLLTVAGFGLAQSTPLTEVERLKIEIASLKIQALESQKAIFQREAQAILEAACGRGKIEVASCQFDAAAGAVKKVDPPKPAAAKPEVKK
jgi:hypothetical protein